MRRKTTETFIRESEKVHGETYDYSRVVYKATHDKVVIICHKHGTFLQSPANHLRNQGCDKCADTKNGFGQRKTTEQFIKEAKEIFGTEYIYHKTNYVTNQNEVIITCIIHGDFLKKPLKHLSSKQGCPKCGNKRGREKRKVTLDNFLNIQEKKFGNNFEFPKIQSQYNGSKSKDKITIICKKCSTEYSQAPHIFLKSNGCLNCLMYDLNKPPKGQSLADLYPNSIKLWGSNADFTPFDFYPNSGRKMIWICPTCNSNFVRSIQKQFIKRNIGCKNCKGRIHYTEKKILFELKTFFPDITGDGIGRQVDMFIPSLNLIIEYDGLNWHKGIKYQKDRIKTEKLIKDGYNVIRLREAPLELITKDDIIIDEINQNSNRKQTLSIKIAVSKVLINLNVSPIRIDDYLSNNILKGEKEFNEWLDLFHSIPKDDLKYEYQELNKTKEEVSKNYGISIFQLNKYLIRYNLNKGGGNKGRKPPNRKDPSDEETKKILNLYKSGSSLKAITKSINYSKDAIIRTLEKLNVPLRTNIHNEKKVIKKDLNGQFIKQYNSVKEASDSTGIAPPNISACCIGRVNTSGGYKWEFVF